MLLVCVSYNFWAPIPQLDGYEISVFGMIRNKHGKIMRLRNAKNGGVQVDIKHSTWMVHDLMLRAWTGRPLVKGYRPRHLNGDKSDNSLWNLVWAGRPR
jgi:hypothetical protein